MQDLILILTAISEGDCRVQSPLPLLGSQEGVALPHTPALASFRMGDRSQYQDVRCPVPGANEAAIDAALQPASSMAGSLGMLGIWKGGGMIGSIIVAFVEAVILALISRVLRRA